MATSTGGDYENSYDSNSGSRDLLKPSSRRHALATTGAFFAANALGVFGFPNVASAASKVRRHRRNWIGSSWAIRGWSTC